MTTRRGLLLGFAGFLGLGGLSYAGSLFACRFVPRHKTSFFALLDVVPKDPVSRRIGEAVLDAGMISSDLRQVATALYERPLIERAAGVDCPVTRRAMVQEQCSVDFREGRVLSVDGWILSESEASLCAAATIARRAGLV